MAKQKTEKQKPEGVLTAEELEAMEGQENPDQEATEENPDAAGGSQAADQEPEQDSKQDDPAADPELDEPKDEPEEKVEVNTIFECGFAPMGKSNIAFVHKYEGVDYTYKLELENKCYALPAELLTPLEDEKKDAERKHNLKRFRTALKDNKFVDITVVQNKSVYDEKSQQYIYKAVHAEQSAKYDINGTISLVLKDEVGKPIYD